jgi:hypothetical protein
MKNSFSVFILLCGVLCFSSCGDDVDCSGANFEQELQTELNAVISAGVAYSLNPDDSGTCNAYKDAIKKYVDALKPYRECATTSQEEAEFDASLEEAEQELNDIDC